MKYNTLRNIYNGNNIYYFEECIKVGHRTTVVKCRVKMLQLFNHEFRVTIRNKYKEIYRNWKTITKVC